MTYQTNNIIQASDFNTFALGSSTGLPNNTTPNINSVLGVGYGNMGYGQTSLASVAVNDTVSASNWADLTSSMSRGSLHQNSSLGVFTTPLSEALITYLPNLSTNISTVYNNRLNARAQGTSTTYQSINVGSTIASSWTNTLTHTFKVTFESGDKARYFFNSGGQLKFSVSHSGSGALNSMFSELAHDIGTLSLSAPIIGTSKIGLVSYTGLTQTGFENESYINPNWRPVYNTNYGYYALNTTNQTIFKEIATAESPSYAIYGNSYVSLSAKSNGTQGANGDTGNILIFSIVWGLVPSGTQITGTSTANCTVVQPEVTYLTNSWGTVNVLSLIHI